MNGLRSGMSTNVVKTALDGVVYQEFDAMQSPDYGSVRDGMIFQQTPATNAAKILEVFQGLGLFGERAESANVAEDSSRVGDQIVFSMLNFDKAVRISKNFFDDEQWDVVGRMVQEFGRKARTTQESTGMGVFRNGFTTSLTADAVALFSNSHITLSGDTVDNLGTGVLSETELNTGIVALMEQKDQAGEIAGHMPHLLLVPPALFKTACEIVDSELRSGSADNDINVYSSKYGIYVKQSPFLGAAAGGSDTAWFLLGKNHNIHRFERQGLETTLVGWENQPNNDYIYKGGYREQYGAVTYEGAWASNGTV